MKKRFYFISALLSQLALVLSSPCFALTGGCFLAGWGAMELCRDPRELLNTFQKNSFWVLICLAVIIAVGWRYRSVELPGYSREFIHQMASKPRHLYLPAQGLARQIVQTWFRPVPSIHYESPAYLGIGLLLGAAVIFCWKLGALAHWLKKAVRTPGFWSAAALLAVWKIGRAVEPAVSCGAGVGFWLLLFFLFVRGINRRTRTEPLVRAIGQLILFAVIADRIAFGPRERFLNYPINPSIWGIFAVILPPLQHMRAIGRLSVVGQGFLFALALIALLREWDRVMELGWLRHEPGPRQLAYAESLGMDYIVIRNKLTVSGVIRRLRRSGGKSFLKTSG